MECIGYLKKAQGIKGFKTANIGHSVFECSETNRYVIILESLTDDEVLNVPYYKDTLKPFINFIQ